MPARQPPVLETTLAIEALVDAGFAADHAAVLAAGRWLLLQRIEGPAGPGVPVGADASGWSFGRDGYPAPADTARVLVALSRVMLYRRKPEALTETPVCAATLPTRRVTTPASHGSSPTGSDAKT